MIASRIEANMHLVTASMQGARLPGHGHESGASRRRRDGVRGNRRACYAAILPEERREGIAFLDIGAQSTELAVYYGESLQLASSLPICGDHFSKDVARGLCTTYEDGVR